MNTLMKRYFVALALPEATAAALQGAQHELAADVDPLTRARWVPRANLHLTLKFLGNLTDAQLAPWIATLQRVAASCPQVHAALTGLGMFGAPRPKALYADVGDGKADVIALMSAIEDAAGAVGLAGAHVARVPHVTLARLHASTPAGPAVSDILARSPKIAYGPVDGAGMVLFESILGPESSRYVPVMGLPLRK